MLTQFIKFKEQENLFHSTDKILLGVSGGIDSVVMMDLFSKARLSFGIAHCNFGLRGKESDDDNSFVEIIAKPWMIYLMPHLQLRKQENNCELKFHIIDGHINVVHPISQADFRRVLRLRL